MPPMRPPWPTAAACRRRPIPPRTSPTPTVCCAACPAPTRGRRAKRIGGVRSRTPRAKSGHRSRASAPTRSTVRWRTSRAFRTSCRPARARRCGRCRRSASNIVIPSSTFSRGEPRRSSRSHRSSPVPTKPMPASFPTKMRRAWCSIPATCSVSTSSPAMTASRAAVAPMPACRQPRNSIMAERSLRVFGQSYQLFGLNSFAVADATNTGTGVRPRQAGVGLCRQPVVFA